MEGFQSEAHLWIQPQWPQNKMALALSAQLQGSDAHIE